MHKSRLDITDHRPYPPPSDRPWVMRQTWSRLLFAHWQIDERKLRAHIPAALEIDSFDRTCWIGVVPFRMSDVSARSVPALPFLSDFLELNVRTYVKYKGKTGVYFFSLDASNPLAVHGARATYNLPYHSAKMSIDTKSDGSIHYKSQRAADGNVSLEAIYKPSGPVFHSKPGSLEEFLTERYCLFVASKDSILCGDIHHVAWPLQLAEAQLQVNTMASPFGIDLPAQAELLHYADEIHTVEWALIRM